MTDTYLAFVKLSSSGAPGKTQFEAKDVIEALATLRERTKTKSTSDIYEYELFRVVKESNGLVSVAKKLATSARAMPVTVITPPAVKQEPSYEETAYTSYQLSPA